MPLVAETKQLFQNRALVVIAVMTFSFAVMLKTRLQQVAEGGQSYLDGDWLINYQGGFIRRGLFGEIIYSIANDGKSALTLVLSFQTLMYLILMAAIFHIASISHSKSFNYLILLNPAGFLFAFIDWGGGFRKEIIFYASLSLLYFASLSKRKSLVILSLLLFYLGAFSWEGMLFQSFLYSMLLYRLFDTWKTINRNSTKKIFLAIFNSLNVAILLILLQARGDEEIAARVCESWIFKQGLNSGICDGAISAIGWPLKGFLRDTWNKFPEYLVYGFFLCLGLLPFLLLFRKVLLNSYLYLVFMGTIPLFALAIDYGRWVSLIVITLTLTFSITKAPRTNIEIWYPMCFLYVTCWGFQHIFGDFKWLTLIGKVLSL